MTSRDFAFWFQGYLELNKLASGELSPLNTAQVRCVAAHLALVFVHEIDPSAGGPVEQAKLDAVHEGASMEDVSKAVQEALDKLPKTGSKFHDDVVVRC